jgi:hypothetical protein
MGFKIVYCAIAGIIGCSCSVVTAQVPKRHHLSAPTYYIATKGSFEASDAVRMQGATNLPPGANIELYVAEFYGDTGDKGYSDSVCVRVERGGLFKVEVHPKNGTRFHPGLFAVAMLSFDSPCKQEAAVRKIIGETGQYLGNDNYDDSFKKTWEETPGMTDNPQLEQTTHWHFGLYAIARIR